MPEHEPARDDGPDLDAEFAISYRAVTTGLPVVTRSGEQFGVVEHVLEVPELDLFDGIVVYTGTGLASVHPGADPRADSSARARMLRLGQLRDWLRFVDADQVAVITPGHVRCTFDSSQVPLLPAPGAAPVYHVDMEREEHAAWHGRYGRMFSRPHWKDS